jgi:hypothetical protein
MSEERLERIENQLTLVIQGMTMMKQGMTVMQHDITGMQQSITGMQQTMATKQDLADLEQSLRNRIDSVDGTLTIAIREGFSPLHEEITDLNIDLALEELKTEDIELKTEENARKIRRLNQRLFRIEGGSK